MDTNVRFKGSIADLAAWWDLILCGILSQTAEPSSSAFPKYLHGLAIALIQQQTHSGNRRVSSHKAHHDVRRQLCAQSRFFSAVPSSYVGRLKPHESIKEQLQTLGDSARFNEICFHSQSYDLISPINLFSWHIVVSSWLTLLDS